MSLEHLDNFMLRLIREESWKQYPQYSSDKSWSIYVSWAKL